MNEKNNVYKVKYGFSSKFIIFISFLILICGSLFIYMLSTQIFPLIICSSMFIVILIGMSHLEYIRRPVELEILPEEIHLIFRTRGLLTVRMEDIEWMHINPGDESSLCGKLNKCGNIKIKNINYYTPLDYITTCEIRDAYYKKIGKYPLTQPRSR